MRNAKPGQALACRARKSRKSHCGMKATNRQRVGRCEKSASVISVSPTMLLISLSSWYGRRRNSSRRPSSWISSRVEGWTVSPRKSRRKSPCFSSTITSTPARAKRKPSIMPAGPPPTMQQRQRSPGGTFDPAPHQEMRDRHRRRGDEPVRVLAGEHEADLVLPEPAPVLELVAVERDRLGQRLAEAADHQ